MTQSAKFWDKIAERYAQSPVRFAESYQQTMARTRSYLTATDRVLEIGAGTGSTALELAPLVAHLTATDFAPQMVKIGAEKARTQGVTNIDFVVADALVPDLTGPFDVVLAHNVLHLVDDLPALLARLHDLLTPGGLLISKTLCTPQRRGPLIYYALRLLLPIAQALGKAPALNFMSVKQLETALTDQGFEIIESTTTPAKELRRYIVARR